MRIKTSEAEGEVLNYLVAKCEGVTCTAWKGRVVDAFSNPLVYHDDWAQGGPIIERYGIELNRYAGEWMATLVGRVSVSEEQGPTPLIAAMRCYVASKLGDEVEVPNEIVS